MRHYDAFWSSKKPLTENSDNVAKYNLPFVSFDFPPTSSRIRSKDRWKNVDDEHRRDVGEDSIFDRFL